MAVDKQYEYDAVIRELPEKGGAYVVFPWNIREEFGKGRVKVHATFDGIPYDGSIVNMGVKNEDGSVCYILGMLKSIRTQLGKGDGDTVHMVIRERTEYARPGTVTAPGQFLFRQLPRQQHSDLHPMYKSRPLMLPAEKAHWVYDLVHLLQRYPVHQLVQLMKTILDLSVRHGVTLAVGFIEKVQNGIRDPQIRGMGGYAFTQDF